MFGWCPELRLAWTCPASDTTRKVFAKKELALAAQDMLPPTAVWEDGTTHEVAELTSLAAQSINEDPASKATLSIHWSGRTQEGYPVVVKDRSDRSLLVSCYVSGKQKLQIDADKEGYDRAKDIVVNIAKKYVAGSLGRAHLYRERDRMLAETSGAPPRRITSKIKNFACEFVAGFQDR